MNNRRSLARESRFVACVWPSQHGQGLSAHHAAGDHHVPVQAAAFQIRLAQSPLACDFQCTADPSTTSQYFIQHQSARAGARACIVVAVQRVLVDWMLTAPCGSLPGKIHPFSGLPHRRGRYLR